MSTHLLARGCFSLAISAVAHCALRLVGCGDILGSSERFYPGRLPELLPAFLAGEAIDEPFEFWN